MEITVQRIERIIITGNASPIDEHRFTDRDSAFKFLTNRIPILTSEHMDEIIKNPTTSFEHQELINRGDVAYSGTVVYDIKVK